MGISRIELFSSLSYFGKSQGLAGSSVIHISPVFEGELYVGANFGVFKTQWDKYNNPLNIKSTVSQIDEAKGQSWSSIIYDDKLYITNNINIWEFQNSKLNRTVGNIGLWSLIPLNNKKNYFIGGGDFNLHLYKLEDSQLQYIDKIEGFSEDCRFVVEDEDGYIWVSNPFKNFTRLKLSEDGLKVVSAKIYGINQGLPDSLQNKPTLFKNKLYALTKKGIYNYIKEEDRFVQNQELSAVLNNQQINQMKRGTGNDIWIRTDRSIYYFKPDSILNKYELIQDPFKRIIDQSPNNVYPISENETLISTDKGFVHYNPLIKENLKESYYTHLRRIEITTNKDSTIYNGAHDSTFIKDKLSYKALNNIENNLRFTFAAAYYRYNKELLYSCYLEGYDKGWSDWSKKNIKEYTNLPERKYIFKVKGKNIFGVESEIASYEFDVLPPWNRTWWAYSVYLILAVLFIYLVVKLNLKRLKAANVNLENTVKERTHEVQEKNAEITAQFEELSTQKEEIEAQSEELRAANDRLVELDHFKDGMTGMIVHDLKNPLSTILGLSNKPEVKQAGQQMLNMVLNILDVQKFENAEMKLQLSRYNLIKCVNEALQNVQMLMERKSIKSDILISANIFIKADYEIIVRVFVNILTNAIKYTPNNGKIALLAEEAENSDFIKISISDTGQGIPQDKLHMVFDKFSQLMARKSGSVRSTGLGLSFCKLAIEAHGGNISVESEQSEGTTFWFFIPKAEGTVRVLSVDEKLKEYDVNIEKELTFTSEDITYLSSFCELLNKYTVYEFSDLAEILTSINTKENSLIIEWKQQLENAIRACNEEKFNVLINLNTNE